MPPLSTPPAEIPFDPYPILSILTDGYQPCTRPELADREVSSGELQLSILSHTGEEVPLAAINRYMKQHDFTERANSSLEIVWMMSHKV
jgi:hypothetical protein